MSIARDEAERLYPIHRAGDDRAGFIQPAIDVLSQNAYAKGRTAEPCREQVEAVARVLRDTFTWNHVEAPERVEDYHCFAQEILDAARKAVM